MTFTVNDDKALLLERRIRHLENELELTRREKEDATQKYFEFYAQLEDLVKERTADLQQTRIELEEKNQSLRDALGLVEKANTTRNVFLANVSHELRTPLNAILGFAQILSEEKNQNNSTSKAYIGHIIRSANHLSSLIDDLIALSKLEAGVMDLEENEVRLSRVIDSCREDMDKRVDDANIVFEKKLPDKDPLLLLDSNHVKRILFHLMDNAIRHTENGRIVLEVKMDSVQNNHTGLTFTVTDNGQGIPPGLLKKIKAYFKKSSSATAINYEGLGIGLVLCNLIAREMNGELTIDSTLGKGTTVALHLKDIKIFQRESGDQSGKVKNSKDGALCTAFLVIDDTEPNITLLRHYYDPRGVEVLGAGSVKEGMHLARDRRPDLVLMDLNMPDIDGFEGLKMFRAEESFKALPVIAFSASNDAGELKKARQHGFDDYLLKPVDFELLTQMLRRYSAREDIATGEESDADGIPDMETFPRLAGLSDRFVKHYDSPVLSEIRETLSLLEKEVRFYEKPELEKWYNDMKNAVEQFDMGYLSRQFQLLTKTEEKNE